MAKVITVNIDTGAENLQDAGSFNVDLTGFEGVGCDAIIKAFEGVGEATRTVHKPEWKPKNLKVKVAGR
jgi:hypothetical protein